MGTTELHQWRLEDAAYVDGLVTDDDGHDDDGDIIGDSYEGYVVMNVNDAMRLIPRSTVVLCYYTLIRYVLFTFGIQYMLIIVINLTNNNTYI